MLPPVASIVYIGWQWRNFFIPYLCQLGLRHDVWQAALRNACYCDIGRRLDVYHTSTHGVALVRIQDAWSGLKRAARGSLEMQDAKKSPKSRHLPTNLLGYIFATKAGIDNRKKLVKQQYRLHMSW